MSILFNKSDEFSEKWGVFLIKIQKFLLKTDDLFPTLLMVVVVATTKLVEKRHYYSMCTFPKEF